MANHRPSNHPKAADQLRWLSLAASVILLLMNFAMSATAQASSPSAHRSHAAKRAKKHKKKARKHASTGLRGATGAPGATGAVGAAGAAGAVGATGSTGAAGTNGTSGANGSNGAPGSALAYAHVIWDGTSASFDSTQTSGMGAATVTKRLNSSFCFGNLPFAPHSATANVDSQTNGSGFQVAEVGIAPAGSSTLHCGAGEGVEVETSNAATLTGQPVSFYITFT